MPSTAAPSALASLVLGTMMEWPNTSAIICTHAGERVNEPLARICRMSPPDSIGNILSAANTEYIA